ncbi:MAG: hypothetical protein ABJA18_07330 [bacterium]
METSLFHYLFVRRWPVMLVVLMGLIFAIIRWRRHPKVSALTLAGLLLFQLQSLAFSSFYYFLPRLADHGWTWRSIDHLSIVLDICHDLVFSVAIALLAAAVFTGRTRQGAASQPAKLTPI